MARFQVDLLGSCRAVRLADGQEKELRELLGPDADVLETDRFTVGLRGAEFAVDVLRLRGLIALAASDQKALLAAAALWQGELFGTTQPNAPVFEAWLQIERSNLRSTLTMALTDHLERLIGQGSFTDTAVAEELVRIEPSHELAHQYLMRFHALRGDQSAALRQYAQLEKALADELDSEPSEASNALLVAIKAGEVSLQRSPPPAPPETVRTGPPRITIRPPLTRYPDRSKDYLGEGFAYLAKSCLSRFRCWIVIPWPATGYGSASAVDFSAVGRAVDADFAVDCVLDWRGATGKLFVSLIDCRDGSEVWSNLFPVAEDELQAISSSVAGAVAASLASQVNHITLLRHARSTPGNPVAYDLWLRGHQLSRLWTTEADTQAEALFRQALALDQGLAASHVSLAQILMSRSQLRPGYANVTQDREEAFRHAQDALALDPYDARCHNSVAWGWLIAKSPERANSHFRMALDINPNDSETLMSVACGLAFLGHIDDAQSLATQAVQLNPIYPEYYSDYLALIAFMRGDFRAAITAVEKCSQGFPDRSAIAAAAWGQLNRPAEARAAYLAFARLATSLWEGPRPADADRLEDWIADVLPIYWPPGRQRFVEGLRLARESTAETFTG